jgi:hypothetical protein
MLHNDKLTRIGILSFLIMPILLILIGYSLSDMLLPWFMTALNDFLNNALGKMDSICGLCT